MVRYCHGMWWNPVRITVQIGRPSEEAL
jgi:hypothetical protein